MKNKLEKIADAILYEGYLLYPYRKSALKNSQRFNFGLLEPNDYFQTEVLAVGNLENFFARARFLQIQSRQAVDTEGIEQDFVQINDVIFETWDEVVERDIEATETKDFSFSAEKSTEILADGKAKFIRTSQTISGKIEIEIELIRKDLHKIFVKILNHSEAEKFISTHIILSVENAEFVSLLEFEKEFEADVKSLQQKGLFPVLIEKNIMLSSPIILYDFPQIAPESHGDFYDLTEIDEMLTLRTLTLTEAEKKAAISLDVRAERILQQAEKKQLANLHGVFREDEKN